MVVSRSKGPRRSKADKLSNILAQEKHTEYIQIRNRVNSRIKVMKREHWVKFVATSVANIVTSVYNLNTNMTMQIKAERI